MNYWFCADYHLSHDNIIKYCDRPFNNVEKMNSTIIKNHNERVNPEDRVFFLGDFRFGDQPTENEFNGRFIFLQGNHDNQRGRKAIIHRLAIDYGGFKMLLLHNPKHIVEDDQRYDLALTAHVHNSWKVSNDYPILAINIGVDQWDFNPISLGDIHKLLNTRGISCV